MGLKDIFSFIFSKKKSENGVVGSYDVKQYHSLKYALIYAKNEPVFESDDYDIYTRVYKKITLINVLMYNEARFDLDYFKYDNLKKLITDKNLEVTDEYILLIVFKNKNENTIKFCKEIRDSSKSCFVQGLVYDEQNVTLDYYISVPDYYERLNEAYSEDIYFDFAAIDPTRD